MKEGEDTLRLDVGCGYLPSGDVNCDLFVKNVGHRPMPKDLSGLPLKPKKISNFILCDVQYLPFKDSVFEEVFSSHVIEHVDNPFLLFKEMLRVSNSKIVVVCPHKLGDRLRGKNIFHKHFFSKSWFYNAARRFPGCFVNVEYSKFAGVPSNFFPVFSVPLELRVEIRK